MFCRYNTRHKKDMRSKGGFLLVEMLVAVFLFSIVMFVSLGAVLTLVDANRKNQNTKSVVNNLTLVINSMVKTIAVSTGYYCGEANNGYDGSSTNDCPTQGEAEDAITFLFNEDGNNNGELDVYRYRFEAVYPDGSGRITRSIDSTNNNQFIPITAPEVHITKLRFLVSDTAPLVVSTSDGSAAGDTNQPKVVMYLEGYAGTKQNTESSFRIQTTISQRTLDIVYQ